MPQRLKIGRQVRGRATAANDIKLDAEKRTLTFPFSSEAPVERFFGNEILSHKKDAIDLSRLNDSAPLLFNHDMDQYIGVIEKSWVEDNRGFVTVRFSDNALGTQVMRDIQNGILKNVSVGYQIKAMDLTKKRDDGPNDYTATDWEPYEVSMVTVPADVSVGVGRAAHDDTPLEITIAEIGEDLREKVVKILDENKPAPAAVIEGDRTMPEVQPDLKDVRAEAAKSERERAAAINALGEKYNKRELAAKLVQDGSDLNHARGVFLESLGAHPVPVAQAERANGVLDLTDKEKKKYSIVRALNAAISKDWSQAGFERECSSEIGKRVNKNTDGFFLPTNIKMSGKRTPYNATLGTATQGGNLVDQVLMSDDFITILRNKMLVLQLGARMMSGLVGNVGIPKQTAQTVAYWVTEGQAITEDESAAFGLVTLSPKTIGARSQITRQMLLQSTPDIDDLIKTDLAAVLALGIDRAAIMGAGASGQPLGILNQVGVGSVVGGTNGAQLTIDNMIDLESAITVANADLGSLAYLTTPRLIGTLKKSKSTTGQYLWTDLPGGGRSATPGEINGYPVARTNQVPGNLTKGSATNCGAVIFGNWNDLLIGEWGVLEILPNPYGPGFTSGSVDIRALQSVDVAVRHPESFAAMVDATP